MDAVHALRELNYLPQTLAQAEGTEVTIVGYSIQHVHLIDDTWRGGVRTREVSYVIPLSGAMEGNRPVSHVVYQSGGTGAASVFQPEPRLLDELAPFLDDWRSP